MLCAFFLGVGICLFVIWLIFFGIPTIKQKKWDKFEENVVYAVKKNFDKPMSITKDYIKELIKEVQNEH